MGLVEWHTYTQKWKPEVMKGFSIFRVLDDDVWNERSVEIKENVSLTE